MKRRKNSLRSKWFVSFLLASVIAAAFIPFSAYAGNSTTDQKYLVNDDGSQTLLSDQEYQNLKEYGMLTSGDLSEKDIPTIGEEPGPAEKPAVAPDYNGVFVVYSTYFNYYPYDVGWANMYDKLYIEYSTDGVNWTSSGYMAKNWIQLGIQQGYEIGGLTPNTTYYTRTHYAGQRDYLNTTTIRTGMAEAPKIKSVKLKAVKVKYHRVRHYYYGIYLYTEKFYTCKIRVTVKLREKPGTPGIYINGQWVGGNKKTYKYTFTPYPNYFFRKPRNRVRYTVEIRSAQSTDWKGYSPLYSASVKVK